MQTFLRNPKYNIPQVPLLVPRINRNILRNNSLREINFSLMVRGGNGKRLRAKRNAWSKIRKIFVDCCQGDDKE